MADIAKIKAADKKIGAFVNFKNGSKNELFSGAIKDNLVTTNLPTTCSSKMLEKFISPYEATVIKKLHEAKLNWIGKTNLDEFAMGSSTENSAFGVTKNPWDLTRVPGGSSGGSAAAVAAGMVDWALGSDTGGSIRQPAAFCGVVGLKPTYGRVSRYGLIAMASSLDQIGPITRNVKDAAKLLKIIAGQDKMDATSVDKPVENYEKSLLDDIKGLRIGVPKEYFGKGLDPEIKKKVEEAIKVLEKQGVKVVPIPLPRTAYAISVYYIIQPAEASTNLSRYDGIKYGFSDQSGKDLLSVYLNSRSKGFGEEVKRRIILGTYVLSAGYRDAYYKKATKVRKLIRQDFDEAFKKVDIIATPTTPTTAFKIGEKSENPLEMYLSDVYACSANLSGNPAISVPCGFDKNKLPIGLQLIADHFEERKLLNVAYTYEQNRGFDIEYPKFV